jgi:hypothetical protein
MRKLFDRNLPAVLAALLCALLTAGLRCAAQDESPARRIFDLTNQDRKEQGLPILQWNDALAAAAQAHAERMVREGQLSHQFPGEPPLLERAAAAGAHFEAIAENVAAAPDAQAVENAWMHSTPHRTNILDPKMNALGVGVVEHGGALYAVEDFAQATQALDAHQVEEKLQAALRAKNIDPSMPAEPAEQACAIEHGLPPGITAKLIVRIQGPDPEQLASQVDQQVKPGQFSKAAVGACAPASGSPFTTIRVAILLY